MAFKSILDERESLKVRIYALECIRDATNKPFEYWLAAAKELKGILSEELYPKDGAYRGKQDLPSEELNQLDHSDRKFLTNLKGLVKRADNLKEESEGAEKPKEKHDQTEKSKEKNKIREEIATVRTETQNLITKELEKCRGTLAVKDAILLKEPSALEDQISQLIDNYYLKSRFFKIQVWVLLAVISFAGFGTWKLYSGAESAGEIVSKMNDRVNTAQEKINQYASNIDHIIMEKAGTTINDIKKLAETKVTGTIDEVFKQKPAEQQVLAVIEKKVGSHINEVNIVENIGPTIRNDVAQKVSIEFKKKSVDQRVTSVLKGLMEPKVIDKNYDAMVDTIVKNNVTDRVSNVFKKNSAEAQVMAVLENEVKPKIDPIDIPNEVGIKIANTMSSKIEDLFKTMPLERRVDFVINEQMKNILTKNENKISTLNKKIGDLELRVQEANKNIQFSFFGIWDYSDWFLKTSLILFYLLILIGVIKLILRLVK